MNILFVHNYYQQRGGEDIYFDSLQKLLKDKGHNVYSYTKKSSSISSIKSTINTGINLINDKETFHDFSSFLNNYKKIDIAHVHNIHPIIHPTIYRILHDSNIPILQRVPHYRKICPKATLTRNGTICEACVHQTVPISSIMYKCYRNSYTQSFVYAVIQAYQKLRHFDKYIDMYQFQTEFVQNYFNKHTNIPKQKSSIVRHYVPDHSYFKSKKKDYFVFAGRLAEEKGILQLLQLFSQNKQYKLVVVGDGPLMNQVQKFSKYKNITILGQLSRERVLKILSEAIATIIPSTWYETGPFVLMESYSVGTPVICPDIGVFPEQIKDTGFLYKHTNLQSMLEYLEKLLTNRRFLTSISNKCHTYYQLHYSEKIHYKTILKLYNKLIK